MEICLVCLWRLNHRWGHQASMPDLKEVRSKVTAPLTSVVPKGRLVKETVSYNTQPWYYWREGLVFDTCAVKFYGFGPMLTKADGICENV